MWEIVELFPAIVWSGASARGAQGENGGRRVREGVKQMKIAASEAVVPMLSVHKVG
jgi:hypothetical protein